MLVGYARVSSAEQVLDLQTDTLVEYGCTKIFTDKLSSVKDNRPGLETALAFLREGDTLVVWKLDRLGRSLKDLIDIVGKLNDREIAFKSLTEGIDTATSGGRLIFHIFGALAEFERDLIRERTHAGLAAARARGRCGGRPLKFADSKFVSAKRLADGKEQSIMEICETLGISRATYYRRLKKDG